MLGELRLAAINFFLTLKNFAQGQWFPVWKWWESRNGAAQQPPTVQLQLQPSAVSQLEEQPSLPTARQPNNNGDDQNPNFVDYVMKMQWAFLVIGVCIAAFSAALQALRTPAPLPPTFHWFCMLLELAFLALLVSVYIRRRYKTASLVMAHVAIFLGATAFMLAIAVTFPAPLTGISIALYIVAILAIIFANR
ncbi:uncharacterized protein [Coffea arabica]|uniref:Uncharacterized protein n=1 Tax=Coffea arabica TaxID=13443 RepID=A0ABM4U473_COFAR